MFTILALLYEKNKKKRQVRLDEEQNILKETREVRDEITNLIHDMQSSINQHNLDIEQFQFKQDLEEANRIDSHMEQVSDLEALRQSAEKALIASDKLLNQTTEITDGLSTSIASLVQEFDEHKRYAFDTWKQAAESNGNTTKAIEQIHHSIERIATSLKDQVETVRKNQESLVASMEHQNSHTQQNIQQIAEIYNSLSIKLESTLTADLLIGRNNNQSLRALNDSVVAIEERLSTMESKPKTQMERVDGRY